LDIQNPDKPSFVASADTSDRAVGVYAEGPYAYVADDESGLTVVRFDVDEHKQSLLYLPVIVR
jgi:hypothetical protein